MTRRRIVPQTLSLAVLTLATGSVLALAPGTAVAGEFGRHVQQCAQQHGFSGALNPGMHRGAAGAHHHHC